MNATMQAAPKSPRTIAIAGIAYTYLRTKVDATIGAKVYVVACPKGQEHTIEPWADSRHGTYSLRGYDRGMAALGTLEMVGGRLVDAPEKFRTAKVVTWGWSGQPNTTFHFADGTRLDFVNRVAA